MPMTSIGIRSAGIFLFHDGAKVQKGLCNLVAIISSLPARGALLKSYRPRLPNRE